MLTLAGQVRGLRILDYGGGAGYMAVPLALAGADVTIVDAESNGLETARYYAELKQVSEKVTTLQNERVPKHLKGGNFDLVIAKDIIEHIEDDNAFLNDLYACTKRRGSLILSTQNSFSMNYLIEGSYNRYRVGNPNWCGWDETHLRFYTPRSLRRKLLSAGYRPNRWASVYIVPYNILTWLSLLRFQVDLPALRYIDLTLGRIFPLNRTGWNMIVRATRAD